MGRYYGMTSTFCPATLRDFKRHRCLEIYRVVNMEYLFLRPTVEVDQMADLTTKLLCDSRLTFANFEASVSFTSD